MLMRLASRSRGARRASTYPKSRGGRRVDQSREHATTHCPSPEHGYSEPRSRDNPATHYLLRRWSFAFGTPLRRSLSHNTPGVFLIG